MSGLGTFLIGKKERAVKESYFWNALGGMLNAGQSALLLIVISRTTPAEQSGMFSLAYAIASLALMLGHYSMRNYQATDVKEQYSFGNYISSRVITCAGMLVLLMYYLLKGIFLLDYSIDKCIIIIFVVLMKLIDAAEDVVHGKLQQKGRLDVAAKCLTLRYIVMMSSFAVALIGFRELAVSAVCAFLVSFLFFIWSTRFVFSAFDLKATICLKDKEILALLKECFSLFVGGFLMIYIANAPKYALDKYTDDIVQAKFNYIFMPIYVISVLNSFLYQPILIKMTNVFEERNYKKFLNMFVKQIGIIFVMLLVVLVGAYWLGIPVLSWLYDTDLNDYKIPLLILLVGSGCLAIGGYIGVVLTIMRQQKQLIVGYVGAAVCALMLADLFVNNYGVNGAAVLYTIIVFFEMIIFALMFWRKLRLEMKR